MNVSPPLLRVSGLVSHYPVRQRVGDRLRRRPRQVVRAVDGVSLHVERGELVALVGESGSGKTSTAQAIMRMVDATAGTIELDGRDLARCSQRQMRSLRRHLQIIYQDPYESLDSRFRVAQIVREPMEVQGVGSRAERRRRVTEALERVGLAPAELYLQRHPHELSGGQRQRVAIASALVLQPDLLIADEPVSMLDVSIRAGVLSVLDGIRADGRVGILMITHDLATAAHYADRICVMYLGRIVEQGPARQVIHYPQHPYTTALLSVVPQRDPPGGSTPQVLPGEPPDPVDVPSGCRFCPRCPRAESRCGAEDPVLRRPAAVAGEDHEVACLLA